MWDLGVGSVLFPGWRTLVWALNASVGVHPSGIPACISQDASWLEAPQVALG